MPRTAKQDRVRQELQNVGVTTYGLNKSEAKALHEHLADDEHILAAIYGQFEGSSAMMVATDERLLFIDIRPFHNIIQDTGYDSFSDMWIDEGIAFSKVTVRTRSREYVFHAVNRMCSRRFLNVIEERVLAWGMANRKEQKANAVENVAQRRTPQPPQAATPDEVRFLHNHHIATLSTRTESGYPYGATVFYVYNSDQPDYLFITTKSTTQSARNLRHNQKAAFTITDFKDLATMHVLAVASVEEDTEQQARIVNLLMSHAPELSRAATPPMAQIKDGAFVVYRFKINSLSLKSYH